MPPLKIHYESLIRKAIGTTEGREKLIRLACIVCEQESDDARRNRCAACGGALDAIYDMERADLPARPSSPNILHHYLPLLPLSERRHAHWLGEGNTPCFEVPDLAAHLGIGRLFLKDESVNPTLSTKDRIASVGLSRMAELGIREVVLSSTGNSSTAYARGAQLLPGFRLHVFVGRDFLHRLNYPDSDSVITHVVEGDFGKAGTMAQRFAADNGYFWEGGFFNFARREGLKTAYLEAFDAMPLQPDFVFQAVSSGMGLLGAYKGAIEYREIGRLSRLPALMAVQQQSCAPMAHAFAQGAETIVDEHIVRNPSGLAYAILRGNPTGTYPYIRDLCLSSGGRILAASEPLIHRAHGLLRDSAGLRSCFASATAFAGVIQAAQDGVLRDDSVVLVNLTGGDRPTLQTPVNLTRWEVAA
ncbi:threonine synthase [Mangrovihabitans endophyticus]|uniref:Threonine synthase n=1 Tax=Mangrovihabitans endophyticus TaxID=1751298 RepID=A0A8J3BWS9_9ACTN|nr:pyridoxal-phosphate dependent enzyme [Mangrovihabitans endophyticus]GGK75302.1 threonine synthase [Mangrovihabitans endophyticus]